MDHVQGSAALPALPAVGDAFDVLGVGPRFDVDETVLDARHRALSRALHPDRYAGCSRSERRAALNRAIAVNEAYRVLKDPARRAECCLARLIGPAPAASPNLGPQFLMEMMELRERLGDARRAGGVQAVERLNDEVERRRSELLRSITELFDVVMAADALRSQESEQRAVRLEKLQALLGELRFLQRFLEEASTALDELG